MKDDDVDWFRMAVPQDDGYDTAVVLRFAEDTGYQRRAPAGESTLFDGNVAIRQDPVLLGFDGCRYAEPDHPNLALAEALIRTWPAAFSQCGALLDSICPYYYPRLGEDMVIGSVCGAGSWGFGSIVVTVNHHMGLAEGIVHEMAHHKLRALGIDVESSIRLVCNDRGDLYSSPIRYDCLRPMTAVLHAQYSYVHIAQLDLMVLRQDGDTLRSRAIREQSLAVIIPKLEHGLTTIRQHARMDGCGDAFLKGFCLWCERVIKDGYNDLNSYRIDAKPFLHPIAFSS